MSMLRGFAKAALMKKVIDEARKPHNQVKIKQLVSKLSRRVASRPGAAG